MEENNTDLQIYLGQIDSFREKYSLEKIQSVEATEFFQMFQEIDEWIEKLWIIKRQLEKSLSAERKHITITNEERRQQERHLEATNEILIHLETMFEFAKIQKRRHNQDGLFQMVNHLAGLATHISNRIIEIQKKPKMAIETRQKKQIELKKWTKNKSEFCQYIKTEYGLHSEQYANLKDATYKLFQQYKFPFKWTAKNCYELTKKIS